MIMIFVGLLVALCASVNAGILAGGYSSSTLGGYSTGVISSGPLVHSAPVATSSITQQRIVNSVPIVTRVVASPGLTSASYVNGGNLGNIGYGSSNGGSLNGYGGYGRNGY
ncbi:uncharacterized protein LOC123310611 isoform X2 [Coccinella septempunctata]|uniref:uncharacterized protein LOC123310611 isoform X2 n=1 Tax=Coccinella septempunctata TaxID=41139 RepID=UPI001D060B1F|nr:uncharacterized protein LOC123310611 isoform X2 [Coccinella septempunctata]